MTSMTATEIKIMQAEGDAKMEKMFKPFWEKLQTEFLNPLIDRTFLIFCRSEGLCQHCYDVDTECKSCGGTGYHRNILRQTS